MGMKNYAFLKTFFSPFKRPKLKFYLGKITVGTPYFLPRKWVKLTDQDCIDKAEKMNAKLGVDVNKPEHFKNYEKPVPIKWFGINTMRLGWKTKWSDTDYRFEFPPLLSIVFCGLQFCIFIKAPEEMHYWECWLYYENNIDHKLSRRDRIKLCRENNPCVWLRTANGVEERTDYYEKILKQRYL